MTVGERLAAECAEALRRQRYPYSYHRSAGSAAVGVSGDYPECVQDGAPTLMADLSQASIWS